MSEALDGDGDIISIPRSLLPVDRSKIVSSPALPVVNPPGADPRTASVVPRQPFQLMTLAEVLDRTPPRWLVRRAIRLGEQVLIFGDPAVGKTFLVLDLVLCIAAGIDWRGFQVLQGPVVYLAGEGIGGFGRRAQAWGVDRCIDVRGLPFQVLPHAVEILDADAFERLQLTIAALDPKPVVIVVDTLARYMVGGEENSAKETGVFLDRCSRLGATTGAAVLIVHHKGKGAKAERGSSAIRGASDVMWEVTHENDLTTVVGSKAKDAPMLEAFYLRRRTITLGQDEDGELVSSLVFETCGSPQPKEMRAGGGMPEDLEPVIDWAAKLRGVLATVFGGEASGGALARASGIKRTQHYETLQAEIDEGRIRIVDERQRYPRYALTLDAPEYGASTASPSPSSGESADSRPESGSATASESRESESESAGTPSGVQRANSNSRSEPKVNPEPHPRRRKQRRKEKPKHPQDQSHPGLHEVQDGDTAKPQDGGA